MEIRMHSEIHAYAATFGLQPAAVQALEALFARLIGEPLVAAAEGSLQLPEADTQSTLDGASGPVSAGLAGVESDPVPPRYEDIGRIGAGGMGEVRRVRDRELGRTCAFKAMRPGLMSKASVLARFVEEAQIGAQLQHPNIPPIYDAGRLPDGRPWFTMKEVHGRTLGALIREVHGADLTEAGLRRLCEATAAVCDAVGYAHGRGVVHRDLKPDNVMIGSHGAVYVLDWGLAKVVGRPDLTGQEVEPGVTTGRSADDSLKTRVGGVMGTAAYMPPEQARGQVDRLDARSDVYALGAILYEVLAGRPPYEGADARAVIRQVLAGPPEPPGRGSGAGAAATFTLGAEALEVEETGSSLPEELVALCMRCLSREPAARPADGAAVAAEIRAWLEGASKRAKALEVVAAADAVIGEAQSQRARAARLRAEGNALLAPLKPWAAEGDKARGWTRQDEAEAAEREAALLELRREALLRAALTHAHDLAEAHAGLVELEIERHRAAEAQRDAALATRAERHVAEHVGALPDRHPTRHKAAAYLKGDGALTLHTDLGGAEVMLFRYERHNRRLVDVPVRSLGRTPLREVSLPMGSYLCVLRHPDRAEVRYPVHIERGQHWDGVPPGASEPLPVRLPRADVVESDDCLVPAGWFWSGGDPEAADGLPRRRLWCDDLVVKRFQVTIRDYLRFLDDLVATGREAEALRHQPRERAAGEGAPLYGRDEAGRFVLQPDADGEVWHPDWPVLLVDWFGATAYAAWLAERTGRPWRLLAELEWEKAARAVDGRFYPWGDVCDPTWCCIRASHSDRPLPQAVDSYPRDVSVYGVRGLGGNASDWCADGFRREGPLPAGERVASPPRADAEAAGRRVYRGGVWLGSARDARCAARYSGEPGNRFEVVGFRMAFRPGP